MAVVFVALVSLAYLVTAGLRDIGLSRNRQTATGVANSLMEKVRGLAFDDVSDGLLTADVTDGSDPNIVECSGSYHYESCSGEKIVHSENLPPRDPLVPHYESVTVADPPRTFDRYVYVTEAADAPSAGAFRVTVVVTWDDSFRPSSDRIEVQTLVYAPEGCLDLNTHPYSGPCEPFFFGKASSGQGRLGITGSVGKDSDVATVDASLGGLKASAELQLEQVITADGRALASDAVSGGSETGGGSAASSANNDPALPGSTYDTEDLNGNAGGTLSVSGSGVVFEVSAAGGDGGTTVGAMTANGTDVCPPTAAEPAEENDDQPCAYSDAEKAGALTADLDLTSLAGGPNLGTATIANLAAHASPTWVFADREADPDNDGEMEVEGRRRIGEVRLADVPSGVTAPSGWSGYFVRLTDYDDQVTAAVGAVTAAPDVTISTGTVEYWDGSGYSSITMAEGAATSIPVADVSLSETIDGKVIEVTISGSLETGGSSTSETPAGAGADAERTAAKATAGSPITGSLDYTITVDGTTVADLDLAVDLGTLLGQGTYQEAPDGS